jgi:drug/metabolite transporter (DMT)-like permease
MVCHAVIISPVSANAKHSSRPHLNLFMGAALISLSPVWVRLVDVPPTVSAFYRVLIGGGALAIFLIITRRRLELSQRIITILLIGAVFFALDLWFWHRSIDYIGPGLATLVANFQVFFMMLAGILFLGQSPKPIQWVAVPLAILGLALLVGFEWQILSDGYRLGIILALLTAMTYTGYLLSLRTARALSTHRLPTREVALISLVTAAMLGISIGIEGESFAIPTAADAGWLFAYGILSHCIGWLLIASSLPKVTTTQAGIALLLQPALSYVWEILFFGRTLTAMEVVGAVIALFAIYLGSRE